MLAQFLHLFNLEIFVCFHLALPCSRQSHYSLREDAAVNPPVYTVRGASNHIARPTVHTLSHRTTTVHTSHPHSYHYNRMRRPDPTHGDSVRGHRVVRCGYTHLRTVNTGGFLYSGGLFSK